MELFSVALITFNQEDLILETLNSVYNQDYSNIELVISDDCSTDETYKKIVTWLDEYGDRFSNTKLIRNDTNQGVVQNMFRAIRKTQGMYLKTLSGDDILAKDALSKAYYILKNNKGLQLFVGDSIGFKYSGGKNIIVTKGQTVVKRLFLNMSPKKQFRKLCTKNYVNGTAIFYNRTFFDFVNLDDYSFKVIEDRPLWLLATLNGIRIHYFRGPKVFRRIHEKSLSVSFSTSSTIEEKYRRHFFEDKRKYIDEIIKPNENLLSPREKKTLGLMIKELDRIKKNNYRAVKFSKKEILKKYIYDPYLFLDIFSRIYNKLARLINSYKKYEQELAEAIKEPKKPKNLSDYESSV